MTDLVIGKTRMDDVLDLPSSALVDALADGTSYISYIDDDGNPCSMAFDRRGRLLAAEVVIEI